MISSCVSSRPREITSPNGTKVGLGGTTSQQTSKPRFIRLSDNLPERTPTPPIFKSVQPLRELSREQYNRVRAVKTGVQAGGLDKTQRPKEVRRTVGSTPHGQGPDSLPQRCERLNLRVDAVVVIR